MDDNAMHILDAPPFLLSLLSQPLSSLRLPAHTQLSFPGNSHR